MISSPNRSRRSGKPVRLVVVHTAEGARTIEGLGGYFQLASSQASSHVGIDASGVEQYVPYSESSWTLRSGNSISDNAELCAFAQMTREQWLSEETVTFYHRVLRRNVTVDDPMEVLRRTAAWIAERCATRDIPLRKLTPAEVAEGKAGVIGHVDWTRGARDGTHTDPGDGFPWDVVMELAGAATATATNPAPREETDVLENIEVHGSGGFRRIVPIGKASAILSRAWVSIACDGASGATARVYFQSDYGGIDDVELTVTFRDGWSSRVWHEAPDGTTQIVVLYDAPDGAVIALEAASK